MRGWAGRGGRVRRAQGGLRCCPPAHRRQRPPLLGRLRMGGWGGLLVVEVAVAVLWGRWMVWLGLLLLGAARCCECTGSVVLAVLNVFLLRFLLGRIVAGIDATARIDCNYFRARLDCTSTCAVLHIWVCAVKLCWICPPAVIAWFADSALKPRTRVGGCMACAGKLLMLHASTVPSKLEAARDTINVWGKLQLCPGAWWDPQHRLLPAHHNQRPHHTL